MLYSCLSDESGNRISLVEAGIDPHLELTVAHHDQTVCKSQLVLSDVSGGAQHICFPEVTRLLSHLSLWRQILTSMRHLSLLM